MLYIFHIRTVLSILYVSYFSQDVIIYTFICIGYNLPPSWMIFIITMPEGTKHPGAECL